MYIYMFENSKLIRFVISGVVWVIVFYYSKEILKLHEKFKNKYTIKQIDAMYIFINYVSVQIISDLILNKK
jgi:hypothetical protein